MSLVGFFKSLLQTKVFIFLVIMITYTSAMVFVLNHFGFWQFGQITATFLWFIFAVNKTTNYTIDPANVNILQDVILYHLKLAAFVEFIVSAYTFSLPVELVLVPIVTLILVTKALYDDAKEGKAAAILQEAVGVGILGYAAYRIVSNYESFLNFETAINFVIPALLSIGLLSPLYLSGLYASYERIFTHVNIGTNKEEVKSYAKKQVLKHCHFNLKRVQEYAYGEPTFMKIYEKDDVDRIINS